MPNRTGMTRAGVKLRAGPGTQHAVLAFLLPRMQCELLDEQGEWLHLRVAGKEGYAHRSLILLSDQGVADGFFGERLEPTPPPSPPPPAPEPAPAPSGPTPVSEPAPAPATEPAPSGPTPAPSPEPVTPPPPPLAPPAPPEPAPPSLADVSLAPPDPDKIVLTPSATGMEKLVANTWNRYGGLLAVLSQELKIDPAAAVAVFAVESGGRGFAPSPDGRPRMIIRFENHLFFDQWGRRNPDTFHQHFTFSADKRWTSHAWRSAADQAWREFHGNQDAEWEVFEFARALDDTAAKLSISMGAPQIVGFNYSTLGFESVQQMFDSFSADDRNQVVGFFDFVQGPSGASRRVLALQAQDFNTFAAMYNGPGQAARYGSIIRSVFDTFHRLKPA